MVATEQAAARNELLESKNPATDEVIGALPIDGPGAVASAIVRARAAFEEWSAIGYHERRAELARYRRALAARADDIADLVHRENGKPRLDAMIEVMMAVSHLAHAAARAEKALAPQTVSAGIMANFRARISYHPVGVVGVIGPWNYPIFTPMGSIAYALAAGNAVVFKPSELTPLVGRLLGEIAAESIAIPNVLQIVIGGGATGAALAGGEVDKIAFTGSAATGKKVMAAAAERLTPVLMELGGKDPLIVAEDADLDKAAEAAVFGALSNAGQACVSIERAYVVAPIYDHFVAKVLEEARKLRTGASEDDHIGAMTSPQQVEIVRDHVRDALDKGARLLLGELEGIHGNFIAPMVLADLTPDMKILREETFGPVLPLVKVGSTEEALRLANASNFGLGSAVFGKAGIQELADRIRAGMTAINSVLSFAAIPNLPFGGVGESGFGRIHGDEGLREFTRTKATAEQRFSLPLNLLSFNLPKGTYERVRGMITQLYGGGVVDRAGEVLRKLW